MKNDLGEKLVQLRQLRNMSQQELAQRSRLSLSTVNAAEKGEHAATATTIAALAYGLGVKASELFEPTSGKAVQFMVYLDDGAVMPCRAHEDDAGFDLYAPTVDLVPKRGSVVIDTGVHVAIPKGYAGLLVSKSGLNVKHDIISDGLIDAGYTGSIKVKLYNLGETSYIVEKGDKISQLVFIPIAEPELIQATWLEETPRGSNGFGSTGRK